MSQPFADAAVALLEEAFEGIPAGHSGTWFVQGKEGLFDAVSQLTAEQASQAAGPQVASIAAHLDHVLFALRLANAGSGGAPPEGDWESSWRRQKVTTEEWESAVFSLRIEAARAIDRFRDQESWTGDAEACTGVLAILPHIAFHLGAIRQLVKLV